MKKTLTIKDIAKLVGGEVFGDSSSTISAITDIETATKGDIAFISNPKYASQLSTTKASAVLVTPDTEKVEGINLIVVKDPYLAFALISKELHGATHPEPHVDKLASINRSAKIGSNTYIGPFVVIEAEAVIEDYAVIYPGVYIGQGSRVGKESVIYPNVSIREGVTIGKKVIIHSGSVIGSDGFGFAKDSAKYVKIEQAGGVIIGDDVEIGANVTIDRAAITGSATTIGRGTKIDNLVQIAHNVVVGEDTVIVSQAGISGSTTIGSRVTIAGQAGVAGHIKIADDSVITAKAGVTNTIKKAGAYSGYPVVDHKDWLKQQILIKKLSDMKRRIEELEEQIKA
ncbi:MAG: UDP-3-O-(3-hydroxymyristoyl)glucosamine N-acyltransferase [Deltaproteobacteria bacterium]|nr:UDP-3-O-(3-hydroxymyristoyl)glucosamine N-acyltransferase [Deltaproteobacteria bacterium]